MYLLDMFIQIPKVQRYKIIQIQDVYCSIVCIGKNCEES